MEGPAIARALANRRLTRSSQVLTGIVAGIMADGQLHDLEVRMLRAWLAENADVAAVWPGSAIAQLIDAVLADGVIDDAERAHLMQTLAQVCNNDFAETGSVSPEVAALPFDEGAQIDVRDSSVCHTGEFLYGTRKACEALTQKAGGWPVSAISGRVRYLVVGTHVSPNWINESYGRKIQQALELRQRGLHIFIVREQDWIAALGAGAG